ncbi:MAG: penicillin-binding protein 2 [Psychroflexus sp.]|nr:penicillin-binding protein 2 [Psychroflexus sp.]MDR9447615.1 penicillin-binding protein 2 [Psychroflexus sp.]
MRKFLPIVLVSLSIIIFVVKLFYLQIVDDSYKKDAIELSVKKNYTYPQRGYIRDRNGKLLVENQPAYDVMIIPYQTDKFDTTALASLLNIPKNSFKNKINQAINYSWRLPSTVLPQLTKKEYAAIQERMYKYEGFYIQKRSLRNYNTDYAANVLGYIAEVNRRDLKNNPYYQSGDLIGRQGVEQQYEELLRGVRGVEYIKRDRFNRSLGPYKKGAYDTLAQKGKDISLTIDIDLQSYGQKLMKNKRGGIVALEPETGEILALVSSPNYDPSLLVGRKRSRNFTKLWYDTIAKPLYDRGLQAVYPPGSTFKPLTGLIALQEDEVGLNEKFSCYGGYTYARGARMGCHNHKSPLSMEDAVAYSCNSYFAQIYSRSINKYETPQKGMNNWHDHLTSFGLGNYLGYDLPVGRKGLIPDADYYNRAYDYPTYKWYASATISNAIGQGEVLTTPIQLANVMAAIANRGWYKKPHILKKINDQPIQKDKYVKKRKTTIDKKHFEPIIDGLNKVFKYGTARFLQVPDVEMCGKTGTAENKTVIDGKTVQLTDHSIFVAFAPKDNPKIALAVFVENGHWGATYAGRIASLMTEKYLKGNITRKDLESWILNHSLQDEYAKPLSGEPFEINQ